MANITSERTGEFLRTLFGILIENPDGIQAITALRQLQKKFELTKYESADYESGGR